jgi:apolipoprotein N-acyltransferase
MTVASFGGIWLVSFLVWGVNLLIARNSRKFLPLGIAVVAGSFLVTAIDKRMDENLANVGVVQIPAELDEDLVREHKRLIKPDTLFAVWPEFAGIIFIRDDKPGKLQELASESGVGIITSYKDSFTPLPHNVSSLVTTRGESERYEKRKLFGGEANMHTPGTRAVAATYSVDRSVGLNICFDSCYPNIIRETAALPNVSVIALPTIDPESPHHFLAAMHASYTPFRSAENGVSMVRVDGHYGSMSVDSQGKILDEFTDERASETFRVSVKRRWTLCQIIGDASLYTMIIAVFGGILARILKREQITKPQ